MDRNRFNTEVPPHLTTIQIGRQGIAFDRLELDAWVDHYKSRNGRPASDQRGGRLWDVNDFHGCVSGPGSGISSAGTGDLKKAELMLARRIEEVRQAKVFGIRPARTFREAATRFLEEDLTLTEASATMRRI